MPQIFLSAHQMRALDRLAVTRFAIPSLILMENAGRAVADEVLRSLPKKGKRSVVVICGKGNNGGDGLVCARHLQNSGVRVSVFLTDDPREMKGDAKVNYEIIRRMGLLAPVLRRPEGWRSGQRCLKRASVVVDSLFGTGFSGEADVFFSRVIAAINCYGKTVVAVDVPSGLDATTGRPALSCVRAAKTVTFAYPKRGFLNREAAPFLGRVVVRDISIPPAALKLLP